MNILLFKETELSNQQLILNDYRHQHLLSILKSKPGDAVKVGILNSLIGTGTVLSINKDYSTIIINELTNPPPQALNVKLILAMQRPKMLKRMLRSISQLGIKEVHLIHSSNVEKSYWETPLLENENYNEYFTQGLEQSLDTIMPTLKTHKLFKPFAEDIAPKFTDSAPGIILHPYAESSFQKPPGPCTLCIGPERGFTDYEVNLLTTSGFTPMSFGNRILRSEVFLPAILGQFL